MNIGALNEDLLLEVLQHLTPEDTATAACVCRGWCAYPSSLS